MMKKLLLLFTTAWAATTISAQTLTKGDIVVVGYASDTGTQSASLNEFTWVPLVNLQQGTKIYFTDAGYNAADAAFMGTGLFDEILLRYIVPEGGIAAGTLSTVTEQSLPSNYTYIPGTQFGGDFDGLISLPNAGDQITVFQSDDDENIPLTFGTTSFNAIFMVTGSSLSFSALTATIAGVTPTFNLDNVTNLAPGLTSGVNAIAVGTGPLEADETDNARYTGITSGTREEILAAVCDLSNWARHDVAFGNDLVFGANPNGWTRNGVASFHITGLGINLPTVADIAFYPNPAETILNIRKNFENVVSAVRIYTTNGQLLLNYDKPGNSIDVSNLSAGVYYVQVAIGEIVVTKKMVRR